MEKISNLFGQRVAPPKNKRRTERGDLLEYFLMEATREWDAKKFGKLTIGRIAWKLTGVPTRDLYALRSKCEDSRRRGQSWSKTFWWEIKAH